MFDRKRFGQHDPCDDDRQGETGAEGQRGLNLEAAQMNNGVWAFQLLLSLSPTSIARLGPCLVLKEMLQHVTTCCNTVRMGMHCFIGLSSLCLLSKFIPSQLMQWGGRFHSLKMSCF